MEKKRDNLMICFVAGIFLLLCLWVWIMPDAEYSVSERRNLKQRPEFDVESVLSGRFMSQFESYSLDQFPFRDLFRSFKAVTSLKADNNGIYVVDGVINSLEYPLQEDKLTYASQRFLNVYDKYLKENGCRVYLSVIPDKNYFYAEANNYPALDYERLVMVLQQQNDYMTYIDIFPELSGEDYYRTDTHWRQETLTEVAETLLGAMKDGGGSRGEQGEVLRDIAYETVTLPEDFYGVYYGQAALPLEPDKISYLTNPVIEQLKAYDFQNNREIPVMDLSKMQSNDPYELFLGGPLSLVTIENPACENGGHLILFRDSFGSSLAPLLAQEYAKTTLIDIRYILPAMLGNLVDFEDADVLFLYSTMVLNNSETIK